ncbi:MAG: hypothetical protein MJZ36_03915 [Bacteroidaceae bacterium]|nr:hypothetical protein [Bacteroidaceae bacterium]
MALTEQLELIHETIRGQFTDNSRTPKAKQKTMVLTVQLELIHETIRGQFTAN